MDRSRVAIVIPAKDECLSIGSVINLVKKYGTPIVVDDGSVDATSEIALKAGATIVRHDMNLGYDSALNSGFAKALSLGCQYIVTFDADGQHDPSSIPAIIKMLNSEADIVIGLRDKKQRMSEHVYSIIAKKIWGIEDPLSGLKGYRIEVYASQGCFDSIGSIGTQLAIYGASKGCRIGKLPITIVPRDGDSKFGNNFLANIKIFRSLVLVLFKFAGVTNNAG